MRKGANLALICSALVIRQAQAELITFDDLPVPNPTGNGQWPAGFAPIPAGYAGFNWSPPPAGGAVGYYNKNYSGSSSPWWASGVVSGDQAAFTQGGLLLSSSSGTFVFNSVYLTSIFDAGEEVAVFGYRGGNMIHDQQVGVAGQTPTQFTFNWTDVDAIEIYPWGNQMAVDDILVNSPVPEPSTLLASALLLLPFGLQGIRCLRNRKHVA